MESKRSFLRGAVILTAAAMLVKVIGMLYKIPLGNILGAGGMSYFLSAYSVFNPVYALSVSGLPVAVSRMVSERAAQGRYRDVRKIRRVSMGLFLMFGFAGSVILFLGARPLSEFIGSPGAVMSVAAIAPSILFCCIMSSWRGYYQGLGDMTPTAVSQVLESVVRFAFGAAGAWYVTKLGLERFEQTGFVFGQIAATLEQARMLVLPWAAAGAILGVSVSTAAGAFALFLRAVLGGDGVEKRMLASSPVPEASGGIARELLRLALPVCVASAFAHITTVIDVVTVMNRVGEAVTRDPYTVLGMYSGLLPSALTAGDVPSYLYGVYGYTTSMYHLVPSLTAALGVSALPAVSARRATGDFEGAARQSAIVIKLSGLVAIPSGLGMFALAEPILGLLYPARLAEMSIAAPLLRTMGIAAVLAGITTPVSSLFQALGRADIPLKLMAGGAAVKLAANWFLLAVPGININAAPIGTVLCCAFVAVCGAAALKNMPGAPGKIITPLFKPLLCGILCAVAANTCYMTAARHLDRRISTLLSIAVGAVIYAAFVLLLKILTKNEVLFLPNGKKIAKALEKLALLG